MYIYIYIYIYVCIYIAYKTLRHISVIFQSLIYRLFLGVFAKLRKATTSFDMSVCLYVLLSAWNNTAPMDGFSLNLMFDIFQKSAKNVQVPLNHEKNNGILHEDLCTFLSYVVQFFLEKEMFQTNITRKIKTHFCSIFLLTKFLSFIK